MRVIKASLHLFNSYKLAGMFVFFAASGLTSQAQTFNESNYKFSIAPATSPIVVDGKADEAAWAATAELAPFRQNFPYDTGVAIHQTRVKVTHDKDYLYISAICYQKKYVVRSLRRDFEGSSTDIFTVLIDPFQDKLNGFYFAVSPYGAQKEQLIFNSNETNINWDNKWYSNVTRYDDRFEVEMAIPFKTLRYKTTEGINTWNINFIRNNLHDNERTCWASIPRNFRLLDISFNGSMEWKQPPPKPGTNISLIPFVAAAQKKDFVRGTAGNTSLTAGLDAKVAITPSLNLDLTVNPDFSQVEVDRQITDLSRFELFFPERRQFFLENSDLFSEFGLQNSNPFFSRRIGIYNSPQKRQNVQIPIIAGARISGRLSNNLRIGLLDMQTAASAADSLPSINYMAVSAQRKIGTRSNLAFLFVNKESLLTEKSSQFLQQSNSVAGAEFNYGSADASVTGKAFYHKSFSPLSQDEAYNVGGRINVVKKHFQLYTSINDIGKNFSAEVGYVPRLNIIRHTAGFSYLFFPKGKLSKKVNTIRLTPDYDVSYSKLDKRVTDFDAGLFFSVQFQNSSDLSGALMRMDYTYLFRDFDPTNKYQPGYQVLKKGSSYTYFSNRIGFRSNFADALNYEVRLRAGNYFNGTLVSLQNSVSYRWQPYGSLSLDVNYNRIRLPEGFNKADFWLIGPRLDLTFTKAVFFTSFMQYNNQNNNININSRFQWRFKPASDFFLVYTDNYYAQDDPANAIQSFGKKNRALVAKFTYWFNI